MAATACGGPGIEKVEVRIHSSRDDAANRRALGAVEAIAGALRPMPLSVALLDEPEVLRPGQLRPRLALPVGSAALERSLVSLKGPLTLGVRGHALPAFMSLPIHLQASSPH